MSSVTSVVVRGLNAVNDVMAVFGLANKKLTLLELHPRFFGASYLGSVWGLLLHL